MSYPPHSGHPPPGYDAGHGYGPPGYGQGDPGYGKGCSGGGGHDAPPGYGSGHPGHYDNGSRGGAPGYGKGDAGYGPPPGYGDPYGRGAPPPSYGKGDPGYGPPPGYDAAPGYGKGDPGYGKGDGGYGKGDGYGYGKGPPPSYGQGDPGYGYPPPGYDPYGKGGAGPGYPPSGYPPSGYPGYPPPSGYPGYPPSGYPPPGYGKGGYPEPGYGGHPPPAYGYSNGAPPPGYDGYGYGKGPEKGGPPGYDQNGKGGPPGYDMNGKGGCPPQDRRPRSRSRSPLPYRGQELTGPLKEAAPGAPLERHQGAQRDNRPAWMTKGVGVGTEMFGEAKGDMVKPGITRADMEAIEARGIQDGPDPFGEIFKERKEPTPAPQAPHLAPHIAALMSPGAPEGGVVRQPLPDQSTIFSTATGRAPLPPQESTMMAPRQPGAPNPGLFKTEMCTFYPQGKCHKGPACTYAHSEDELARR